MAHLIDKDALVAEIDRLREVLPLDEFQPKEQNKIDWLAGKLFTINSLDFFLDTLEVKEIDLEKELDKFYGMYRDKNGVTHDIKDNEICFDWKEDGNYLFIIEFARHFFELGLKAKQG